MSNTNWCQFSEDSYRYLRATVKGLDKIIGTVQILLQYFNDLLYK